MILRWSKYEEKEGNWAIAKAIGKYVVLIYKYLFIVSCELPYAIHHIGNTCM